MATNDPIPTVPAVNPADLATSQDLYEVALIDVPAERMRSALDPAGIADLARSIAREGQLQPIGLRETPKGFTLIWGARRLAAIKSLNRHVVWAVVYSPDLTDQQARQLEIVENLKRAELSPGERQAHIVDLLALVREEEETESRKSSDFTPTPETGRGHKSAVTKVAEKLGVDPKAARYHVDRAAETIGEVIDQKAPAATIREQAKKVREKAPTVPRRRQPAPATKISRGAAAAVAKSMGPDLLVTMRALEVALPDGFDGARWFSGLPTFQQKGAVKTVRDLGFRLDLLLQAIVGGSVEPAEPAPDVDPITEPAAKSKGAPKCAICGKAIRKDQMEVQHEGKPAHFACVQQPDKASH